MIVPSPITLHSDAPSDFHPLVTADGSPTVRIGPVDQQGEAMHSLKGAFSETHYIYGTAIETALHRDFTPKVLSLGLGLGYVEVLAAALCMKHASRLSPTDAAKLKANFGGESFEIVKELRDWFYSWGTQASEEVPEKFSAIYNEILSRTANHLALDSVELHQFLREILLDQRWTLSPALTASTKVRMQVGCICFDAFSSKTSPDLWTEEFLVQFFGNFAASSCVLSTYACTGALKRSLRASGFELTIREGFSSKRDSTFAVRTMKI